MVTIISLCIMIAFIWIVFKLLPAIIGFSFTVFMLIFQIIGFLLILPLIGFLFFLIDVLAVGIIIKLIKN